MKTQIKPFGLHRKVVLAVLVLVLPLFSSAQMRIDWQQCYGGEGHDHGQCILPINGGYLVYGVVAAPQNTGMVSCGIVSEYDNTWLIWIDGQGILQNQQCWNWDEDFYLKEFISLESAKTDNNEFYMNAHTNGKVTILKLDENLNELWRRTPGYYGTQILPTDDGGVLLGGSYGYLNKSQGTDTILKLDGEGNTEWKISAGMAVVKIIRAKDGGFLVGGSDNEVLNDYYILKVNQNGEIVESIALGTTYPRILLELEDGFLLAGNVGPDGPNAHGEFDILLSRIDEAGNILWQRSCGGSSNDLLSNVFANANGGFTVFGYTNSNDGDLHNRAGNDYDIWVFHIEASGELMWERSIGSPTNHEWIENKYPSVKRTGEYKYAMAGTMCWEETPSGDVNCSNSAEIPNSGQNYWVLHVTDTINSTGIPEPLSPTGIQMYPNPTYGRVTLQGIEPVEVQVFDALGQWVKSFYNTNEILLGDLPKGMYLIKAVLEDGKTFTDKVVKE
ncbi:MAG: T9SS type A sorting domain-containing protein [Bacteroidales bacterium]|nr:T9SS type A sorting domain-containing protein [Bacteroidales bacterium]